MDREALSNGLKEMVDAESGPFEIAVGMRVSEDTKNPTTITFKGLGNIKTPVSLQDLESYKTHFTRVEDGYWEMDLQAAIEAQGPTGTRFFSKSLPTMIDLALKQLKVDSTPIGNMFALPKKLIITESGPQGIARSINPGNTTTSSNGAFATMLVQFPIEGGHQGGQLRVLDSENRVKLIKKFDCSKESSKTFYYNVFHSHCHYETERPVKGSQLTMRFDIAGANPPVTRPSHTWNKVASVLGDWGPNDRLVVIPLTESYNVTDDVLSIADLQGNDKRLGDMLRAVESLEMHLVLLGHFRKGEPERMVTGGGCLCCRNRSCPCLVGMSLIHEEYTRIVKSDWSRDVKAVDYQLLDVNVDTEVVHVGVPEKPLFDMEKPDKDLLVAGPLLEQWYYRHAFVIWPKERSYHFDCIHRFPAALETLEGRILAAQSNPNLIALMADFNQLLSSCKPHHLAKSVHQVPLRLLKICVLLASPAEASRLLDILAYVGQSIESDQMAQILANTIRLIPWSACVSSTIRMVSASAHPVSVQLLDSLLELPNCLQSAAGVANGLCELLYESVDIPLLIQFTQSVLRLEQNEDSKSSVRLSQLTVQLQKRLSPLSFLQYANGVRPSSSPLPDWFRNMCVNMIKLPFTVPSGLLSLIRLIVAVQDPSLTELLVSHVTNVDYAATILKPLLGWIETWSLADGPGRQFLATIVDIRMQQLVNLDRPVDGSWAIKDAVVVGHPLVEAFLRSEQRAFKYMNFTGIGHARNWERKHFLYGQRYPSVETYTFGTGINAYCYLEKKRPSAYSHTYLDQVRLGKIELEQLIERRIQRLGDSECSVIVTKDVKGNCSLLQVQPNENNPVPGTSAQGVDDVPLAVQQVVQSYHSAAATLPAPIVPPIQQPAVTVATANVRLVQFKPKKVKLTAKERAEKLHLKDLLALQDKMGGPGAMFGLNVLMGGKPTQRDRVAAVLQQRIAQATSKVNAINNNVQTAQVVARPVIVSAPRTTVKQPVKKAAVAKPKAQTATQVPVILQIPKAEPGVFNLKAEPGVLNLKAEPGLLSLKAEPGLLNVKTEQMGSINVAGTRVVLIKSPSLINQPGKNMAVNPSTIVGALSLVAGPQTPAAQSISNSSLQTPTRAVSSRKTPSTTSTGKKKLPMPVKRALMDIPVLPNNSPAPATPASDAKRSKLDPALQILDDHNIYGKVDDKFIFLD